MRLPATEGRDASFCRCVSRSTREVHISSIRKRRDTHSATLVAIGPNNYPHGKIADGYSLNVKRVRLRQPLADDLSDATQRHEIQDRDKKRRYRDIKTYPSQTD